MIWKGEQNMKKWMRVLPVLGAAVLLTVGFGHQTAQAKKGEHPVIADRIFIGDVAVGGMTKEEAVDAVQDYVQDLGDKTITLTINDVSVEATAEELGLTWEDQESVKEAVAYGKSGNLQFHLFAGIVAHPDKMSVQRNCSNGELCPVGRNIRKDSPCLTVFRPFEYTSVHITLR